MCIVAVLIEVVLFGLDTAPLELVNTVVGAQLLHVDLALFRSVGSKDYSPPCCQMDQQRWTELRRLFCCHSSFALCCSVVVVRKGFNSLVGRRKLPQSFAEALKIIAKIDSALGTMGRGNPLPFPLPIMPRALSSLFFFPASLRHKLRRRERSLHRVL